MSILGNKIILINLDNNKSKMFKLHSCLKNKDFNLLFKWKRKNKGKSLLKMGRI